MILFFDQLGAPIPYWLVDVRLFGLVDHSSPLSLLLCLACTAILLVGVKESARVNMVITILNVLCILFIVVLGSLHIDSGAWVRREGNHSTNSTNISIIVFSLLPCNKFFRSSSRRNCFSVYRIES